MRKRTWVITRWAAISAWAEDFSPIPPTTRRGIFGRVYSLPRRVSRGNGFIADEQGRPGVLQIPDEPSGIKGSGFFLQAGKLGVYHTEIEYDQLQHLYSTVNPFNDNIEMLVQRLRFSGYYMPTPDINIFAENLFQRRTGQQPATYSLGSPDTKGGYNFTTFLRPIGYSQDDLTAGVEFDRRIYQFRMAYHLSTFEDDTTDVLGRSGTTNNFVALPPSNLANYVTGEGALNLLAYKTRLTGSFSYGWLSQNDTVIDRNGVSIGDAGLTASTMNGYISGVTRPWAPLTLRYAYRAYNFDNSSADNRIMNAISSNLDFFREGHYSYLRQTGSVGADYKVNNMLAFDVAYAWQGVDRDHDMGHTTSNTPQVGIRLFLTAWLNLTANYSYSDRQGSDYRAGRSRGGDSIQILRGRRQTAQGRFYSRGVPRE